jgi:hypothetical protein
MTFKKLILSASFLFLMQASAMAIEEPSYQVIDTYEDFEVRRYDAYVVAEVDVDGGFDDAGNSAFRILAGYIFGDNQAAQKMEMTAPVETRSSGKGEKMAMTAPVTATDGDGEGQTTFAFVMERKYTLDTLPVPNDERIRIREVPERVVAVRRYSGRWTQAKYMENEQILRAALAEAGITITSDPVLARYNSPFSIPFLRRNEVMFEVADSDAQPAVNTNGR